MKTLLLILTVCLGGAALAQSVKEDLEYARIGAHSLKLDLHLPKALNPPLVVYVHGGAWRAGSKANPPILKLLDHGLAIASVDYRLSTEAVFPAQVHDIKAAIRFLRVKGKELGVDSDRLGIIGSSAGGHLAALVGVSNGHKELEGRIGEHLDQSSAVQCIASFYGASNLQTILSQSTEFGRKVRVPALQLLLDGQPGEKPDLAKLASPVAHVDSTDPPLWLVHGDADPQMPYEQSRELAKAYEALKLPLRFITIRGGEHGGAEFYDEERMSLLAEFMLSHLAPR